MRAGTYNFTCEQGATFTRLIELEEPDLVADPTGAIFVPLNIENYTARMQIRRTLESTSPMITLTTENGRLTVNPGPDDINKILIMLTDEETMTLTTDGVYDLEIESTDGVVSRILQGAVALSPEVTR